MKTKARVAKGRRSLPLFAGVVLIAAIISGSARAADPGFLSNLGLLDRLTKGAVTSAVDSLSLPVGEPVTILSQTWHEANWFVGSKMAEELARRGHPVRVIEWSKDGGAPARPTRPGQEDGTPGQTERPGDGDSLLEGQGMTEVLYDKDAEAFADSVQAYADSVAAASYDPLWGETVDEGEPPASPDPPVEPPRREVRRPGETNGDAASSDNLWGPSDTDYPSLPDGHVLDIRIVEFGVQYSDVGRRLLFGPLQFTRIGGVFFQASLLRGPEGTIRRMTSAERHHVDRLSGGERHLAEGASYPFSKPELKAPSLGRYVEPAVVVTIVGSLIYLFYANQN